MLRKDLTICAPATGHGGAISVIRISGPESISIINRIVHPADRETRLDEVPGYTIIYGDIRDDEELIDDVLVSVFIAPRSYTGEDSVEISCHASPYIQSRILELLIRNGATAALPGEFTQRAFMNGKMDLSQAEAVADLVASSSAASHRLAVNQMRGGFSREISELRKELLNFASLIELELDFGEEDVEFADRSELIAIVKRVMEVSGRLADSFRLGNAIKRGIPVAIIGKPNSGKSTLLNALLKEERAIVSEIPGTTRDAIEDTIVIEGVEYRFIDTAGLRDTTDVIESIGIRKTFEKIEQADVILLVDEMTDHPDEINRRLQNIRDQINGTGKKLIITINKTDLAGPGERTILEGSIKTGKEESLLFISAKEERGIDELRCELGKIVAKENLYSGSVIVTSIRHYEALTHVNENLGRVLTGLTEGLPDDLIAIDIRHAIHYLGEITGEITTDEILGNIFKNFCIGK